MQFLDAHLLFKDTLRLAVKSDFEPKTAVVYLRSVSHNFVAFAVFAGTILHLMYVNIN